MFVLERGITSGCVEFREWTCWVLRQDQRVFEGCRTKQLSLRAETNLAQCGEELTWHS